MHIDIDPIFAEKDIAVKLSVIQAQVKVKPSPDALKQELEAEGEALITRLNGEPVSTVPAIQATRKAYKALGKDPARYRPAAEALSRRVAQGKGLYFINNIVELNNLLSLKSGISIGTYDVAKLEGDVIFRRAEAGESYKGIGRAELNLEGLPIFADAKGPFGSPTSDSQRTMVTDQTTDILMVLIGFGEEAAAQLKELTLKAEQGLKNFA